MDKKNDQLDGSDKNTMKWHSWVCCAVGEMLASSPNFTTYPDKLIISENLQKYSRDYADGKILRVTKHTNISPRTMTGWLANRGNFSLQHILYFCWETGITPLGLMTNANLHVDVSAIVQGNLLVKIRPSRSRRVFDPEPIKIALSQALENREGPPESLTVIARRLGRRPKILKKYFPEECRLLSDLHKKYKTAKKVF